jgi:hypothetical protein
MRHALGMVAGRSRDHAARQRVGLELRHLVIGAAQLEGEHRLHVLALEQDTVVRSLRQIGRRLQRRLDRHVVYAGVENTFQIIGFGHALLALIYQQIFMGERLSGMTVASDAPHTNKRAKRGLTAVSCIFD